MTHKELKKILDVAAGLLEIQERMKETGKQAIATFEETQHPAMMETVLMLGQTLPEVIALVDKFEGWAAKLVEQMKKDGKQPDIKVITPQSDTLQ